MQASRPRCSVAASVAVKGPGKTGGSLLRTGLCAALMGFAFTPGVRAQNGSNALWRAQSIYQIFTDRFFDGDPANNNASGSYNPGASDKVHGGDFRGIEQKLDYIKALGATAIWISPVVKNSYGEYHGYAGRDFYSVDPHWGTLSNLQAMVHAAHARGLLVIQDVIVNHGGGLVGSSSSGYPAFSPSADYRLRYHDPARQYAPPFNTNAAHPLLTNLFHNQGEIQDYNNTAQLELGELAGLDDFRTESPYIRTNLAAIYSFWITNAGFDGFRVDTVKHVEMGFWQDWCPRVRSFAAAQGKPDFFMFGEVLDGSDARNGSYSGTNGGGAFKLDSLLDYPLFFAAQRVFSWAGGNTREIEDHYLGLPFNYDPNVQYQLVTFLDNHDTTRFLYSAGGDTNRLAAALAFLYTARGIPCLYQGTEQAFNGGADPANREDMFAGAYEQGPSLGDNFNMTHPLFQLIARLNNFRRLYPALTLGTHVNQWYDPDSPGLFAYARRLGPQEVFVVFNSAASTQTLPGRSTIYDPGTPLVDLLNANETLLVTPARQTPSISVPPMTAKIFIAQAQRLPLDPVVTSFSPAHDATNVSVIAPLVFQFSQPMDTPSATAALTILPPAAGTFSWSADRRALTVVPLTNWPGQSLVTVRLGDSARSGETTNRLFAAFETRFRTVAASDLMAPSLALATPANGAVTGGHLILSGTAGDNVSVARVEVQVDNLGWLPAAGTTSWSCSLNTSNYPNGSHTLSARAVDTAANPSPVSSVNVRFVNAPGHYLQRLAGGNSSNITDCAGLVWRQDTNYVAGAFGYVGGGVGYVSGSITGVCSAAQSLYQRERFGNFSYQFDCPIGVYETTLLEAETYWSTPGQRVFNVLIQGQPRLSNFDIIAAAGGNKLPLSLVFTNAVTNGQLQIAFVPVVDNARVSGVQVQKIAEVFSDRDGIPDWWRLAYFDRTLGAAADASRGNDDADGDGVSNLTEFSHGTSPLEAASVPTLGAFDVGGMAAAGAGFQINCHSTSNWSYQLQRRDSLAPGDAWVEVDAPVAGTGGILTFSDSATNTMRFYRLQAR